MALFEVGTGYRYFFQQNEMYSANVSEYRHGTESLNVKTDEAHSSNPDVFFEPQIRIASECEFVIRTYSSQQHSETGL